MSKQNKHTPRLIFRAGESAIYADNKNEALVAQLYTHNSREERDANGQLFSAAPELLRVSKLVLEMADCYGNDYFDAFDQEVLDQVRKAIAKAEGRE